MKTQFLMTISAALAIMTSLPSCNDEFAPETNYVEKSIQCACEGDEHYVYVDLKEVTEAILPTINDLDWFRIDDAWMEGTMLAIKVVTEDNNTGADRIGQAILPLKNGTSVRVTINQGCNDANPNNSPEADKYFIEHWYEMNDFFLGNRPDNNVSTPWTTKASTCSVPASVRNQNNPKEGWEVVFIDNGMKTNPDRCYFGLYNRYLGKLRVYTYTNTTPSSEYMVRYNIANTPTAIKYAYHSLPVGIPVDCNIDVNRPLSSTDGNTFQNFTVPYNEVGKAFTEGWKAFDIDLSAYSPSNNFFTNEVGLDIGFFASNSGIFNISGTIDGNIIGTFENPQMASVSYNGGVTQTVADYFGVAADISDSLCQFFLKNPGATKASETFKWGGGMFSVAEAVLNLAASETGTYTFNEANPGTIELKTQQKLKMKGSYSQQTASNQPSVSLRKDAFVKAQPYENGNAGNKPYIGEGVWSLATAPTYYIVDDVMLGSAQKAHFEPKDSEGKYYSTVLKEENLRMVSFFDPTSVKVNVNTNLFKNIEKVEVFSSPVVVLKQSLNYSDEYYSLIYGKPIDRGMPICTNDVTYNADEAYKGNNRIKYYMQLPVESTDIVSKGQEIKNIFEGDKPYGLRGVVSTFDKITNKEVMADPEILYKVTGKECTEGKIPDILISVVVRVHTTDGKMYVYSHRFLPNIVHINRADLGKYKEILSEYARKCNGNQQVTTLNNSGAPVFNPFGDQYVARSLKVLDKVINYTYKR